MTISAALIQSVLQDQKIRTRRTLKKDFQDLFSSWSPEEQADLHFVFGEWVEEDTDIVHKPEWWAHDGDGSLLYQLGQGWQKGDILYVKEDHYAFGWWEDVEGKFTSTGKQKRQFIPDPSWKNVVYYADTFPDGQHFNRGISEEFAWHKRLARFMPRHYARIFLEVTDVRIERLMDITDAEAILEGIRKTDSGDSEIPGTWYKDYTADTSGYGDPDHDFPIVSSPVESFSTLWESINGFDSRKANPWVWVIAFKRTDKPSPYEFCK